MARNIKRYGYGPNRSSDTPAILEVISGPRRRVLRTPAQQRAAIEPMPLGARVLAYLKQNTPGHEPSVWPRATPTPRQLRRMRHKSKLGAVAWASGVRPA